MSSMIYGNSDRERILGGDVNNSDDTGTNDDCQLDVHLKTPNQYLISATEKAKKNTFRVLYFTVFIGSISFSIVMSSLWPFLRKMDPNVTETYLGWVNAGFSLGQVASSILFGYWCDKRSSMEPLLVSTLLLFVGSCLYGYAESFGKNGLYVVLAARCFLGLNAGIVTVARAVCAHLSTKEQRAHVMSFLALYQAVGFFVGPGLQAALQPLGGKGFKIPLIDFTLNIYTAPCLLMMILSIINAVLLIMYFKEDFDDCKERLKAERTESLSASVHLEPFDTKMIFVTLFIWFICMSIFTLNETILTPIMMNEFAWNRVKTIFNGSIILSVAGILAVLCFLAIAPLCKRYAEKKIIFAGNIIMFIGFIVYLPWGPGYPKLTPKTDANATKEMLIGCPRNYSWCHTTPALPFMQFLTAAALVGIGYPIACVTINVLFSKIIGPFPQGRYMGWFSSVGGLARVVGPLYVTSVYQHFGLRWSAVGTTGMLMSALLLMVCVWKRLVPYGEWKSL